MQTELNKIVQNYEECQVFLYEKSGLGRFYVGSDLLSLLPRWLRNFTPM